MSKHKVTRSLQWKFEIVWHSKLYRLIYFLDDPFEREREKKREKMCPQRAIKSKANDFQ